MINKFHISFKKTKKHLKKISIIFVLFCFYFFISAYSYVNAISNNLSKNVLRLHVVANSNSVEDQNLKYIVRDNILSYMNSLCSSCKSKEEALTTAKNHLIEFKEIAQKTISENGFSYPVQVEIGNYEFPSKTYGDISFPAGFYDALKINIGSSLGKNWWCVMFPPLCFVNPTTGIVSEDSKNTLKNSMSSEEYLVISNSNNSTYSFKFKIIELFKNAGLITSKNN